jgi:hypothetical protein
MTMTTAAGAGVRGTRARRMAGHGAAVLVALALAAFAFVFRFNALGGALGGFDNDEFATLTRVDLLLDGQQPLRDFADGELRAVWPSLTYEIPAQIQRVWGRNLFVHASYTLAMLAACAGAVFLLARSFSGRWVVAVLAAAVMIVSGAASYNYPKVLSLTIGIAVLRWAIVRPGVLSLGALGAATVAAALFRHDYAVYVGAGALAGLVALQPQPWSVPARRLGLYAALALLIALPSLIWVERYVGVIRHIQDVVISSQTEGNTRRLTEWPVISLADPLHRESLTSFNYYAFWMVPIAGAAVLALLWRQRMPGTSRAAVLIGTGAALVAMTPIVNHFFLRSNLQARFGDATVPVVLLAAWMVGAAPNLRSRLARVAATAGPTALLVLIFLAFLRVNSVATELTTGGFTESLSLAQMRFGEVRRTLESLPPADWATQNTEGTLGVSRYLAECTAPRDQVLVATYADEIPYFASRLLAGGQAISPSASSRARPISGWRCRAWPGSRCRW